MAWAETAAGALDRHRSGSVPLRTAARPHQPTHAHGSDSTIACVSEPPLQGQACEFELRRTIGVWATPRPNNSRLAQLICRISAWLAQRGALGPRCYEVKLLRRLVM